MTDTNSAPAPAPVDKPTTKDAEIVAHLKSLETAIAEHTAMVRSLHAEVTQLKTDISELSNHPMLGSMLKMFGM